MAGDIPVFRDNMPVDDPKSIVGVARQSEEKPNVFEIEFPEGGAFMDFIQLGDLRSLTLSAMITNISIEELTEYREKHG